MPYDKEIVRLEQKLEGAESLLKFFTALVLRNGGAVSITDESVASLTGKERISAERNQHNNTTILKVKTR